MPINQKGFTPLYLVGGLLFLSLLAGGIYFGTKNYCLDNDPACSMPTPPPISSVPPPPPPLDTSALSASDSSQTNLPNTVLVGQIISANCKLGEIYINDTIGFQVVCPEDFEISVNPSLTAFNLARDKTRYIDVEKIPLTQEFIKQSNVNSLSEFIVNYRNGDIVEKDLTPYNISDIKGFYDHKYPSVFSLHGGNVYRISLDKGDESKLNKFLETFKYTFLK